MDRKGFMRFENGEARDPGAMANERTRLDRSRRLSDIRVGYAEEHDIRAAYVRSSTQWAAHTQLRAAQRRCHGMAEAALPNYRYARVR
jgi:hypothetical protein